MKLILAGKSGYIDCLKSELKSHGAEVLCAKCLEELKAFSPDLPVVLLNDTKPELRAYDKEAAFKAVSALKPDEYTVFLMDKDSECPAYIESMVLDTAAYLASKKRRVSVLMRSSRASEPSFEERYMKARRLGVSFIKYESLDISEDFDTHSLKICDGKLSVTLETPLLIDCSPIMSDELCEMAKYLRVKTYGDYELSGGRWFLNEGATFKRNVKVINTAAMPDVGSLVPALLKGLSELGKPGQDKVAFVDAKKCAFCYTCYRVCPHAALYPDTEAAAMKVDELLCSACGICVSACPAAAIEFKGDVVSAKDAQKGKLKVICCENSAFVAADGALSDTGAVIEAVPCGGEVSARMMTDALDAYDKVLVAVCCDEGCKHFDGNKRLIAQVERLKGRLEKIGIDPKRISCVQTGVTMTNVLKDAVNAVLTGGVIQ